MSWVLVYKSKDSLPALKAPVQQPRWVGAGSLGLRWGPFPKRVMSELVMSSPGRGGNGGGRRAAQVAGAGVPVPGDGRRSRGTRKKWSFLLQLGTGRGDGRQVSCKHILTLRYHWLFV